MKKKILLSVLFLCVSCLVFGQAKKPTIMVVPSNQWCIANGYYDEVDVYGTKTQVVNYEKAVLGNADLKHAEKRFVLCSLEGGGLRPMRGTITHFDLFCFMIRHKDQINPRFEFFRIIPYPMLLYLSA